MVATGLGIASISHIMLINVEGEVPCRSQVRAWFGAFVLLP